MIKIIELICNGKAMKNYMENYSIKISLLLKNICYTFEFNYDSLKMS